jgi:nitrate reductase gamma subunit
VVELRLTIFWISLAVVLLLFALAIGSNVAIWWQGSLYEDGRRVERGKLGSLIRITFKTIFSKRFWVALRAFIVDAAFQRKLFQEDKLRWLGHASLSIGFFALFALSAFTGIFEEGLHRILHIERLLGEGHPFVGFVETIIDKNTPIMALLNEVLGIVILFGLLIIIFRRYVLRPAQLSGAVMDNVIIILLVTLMLTSYPVESFRYLIEGLPVENGWYGFLGYKLALLLEPMNWHWEILHFWAFFIHYGIAAVLLLYLPFSKFAHVFISPLVIAINGVAEEMA